MNKIKRSVSQKENKKMRKEIKAAQKPLKPDANQYSDALTPEMLLKSYPAKVVKAETGMLKGFRKRQEAERNKKLKKRSKRTNSGKVDEQSPPAHIHVEGARWIHNLTRQNSLQTRGLKKQMAKRK
jgi:hypothetical protein